MTRLSSRQEGTNVGVALVHYDTLCLPTNNRLVRLSAKIAVVTCQLGFIAAKDGKVRNN